MPVRTSQSLKNFPVASKHLRAVLKELLKKGRMKKWIPVTAWHTDNLLLKSTYLLLRESRDWKRTRKSWNSPSKLKLWLTATRSTNNKKKWGQKTHSLKKNMWLWSPVCVTTSSEQADCCCCCLVSLYTWMRISVTKAADESLARGPTFARAPSVELDIQYPTGHIITNYYIGIINT